MAGGRPLDFKTPKELQAHINAYFADCDPHISTHKVLKKKRGKYVAVDEPYITHSRPYTVSGLALWLGTNRQTLLNYAGREEFLDTIKLAKAKIEAYVEENHLSGYINATTGIFNLKNNYGW